MQSLSRRGLELWVGEEVPQEFSVSWLSSLLCGLRGAVGCSCHMPKEIGKQIRLACKESLGRGP